MKIKLNIYITAMMTLLFMACQEGDEMVLERTKSPVLVMVDSKSVDQSGTVNLDASFYELDKSGILDQNVGIDSIPVSGLAVDVFVRDTELIETLTTNNDGQISFQSTLNELGFSEAAEVRLELAGTHNEVDFRHVEGF